MTDDPCAPPCPVCGSLVDSFYVARGGNYDTRRPHPDDAWHLLPCNCHVTATDVARVMSEYAHHARTRDDTGLQ